MRGGSLRHRITIQSAVVSTGDGMGGGGTTRWDDTMTVWASVVPLRGDELLMAGQTQSEISHKIETRYRSDITAVNRIKFGSSRYFDIQVPINVDERNRELILMCKEITP